MSGGPAKHTKSVCSYCGVGCGVVIHSRGDRVVGVTGDQSHPANFGELCSKGRELHETVHLPNRLLHPEMRPSKGGARFRTTWDPALDRVADAIRDARNAKGPDSVGFYISGQLLTEDYYVFNKLAKGFVGTNNVDSNSRLCMSSAVAGYKRAFGADGPPACYEDIDHADLLFVVGANPAWCHPILFRRMEKRLEMAAGDRPVMIVLDPRRTATAELADIHVPLRIGSDGVFLTALLAELHRRGRTDKRYIETYTAGFGALEKTFADFTADRVESECGISRRLFEEVVRAWNGSAAALTLWTMGVNQSAHGTDTVNTITNLHLATGQIGRPGAGPFSLTGQPNAMGGRETGAMANLLSAHRDLTDPVHRGEVEAIWGSGPISSRPGLTAVELFEKAADGGIEVLWIACTNPAVSMPDASTVRRALERTPLVIVQDIVGTTDTAAFADILLPAAGWAEKSGTVTNSERRLSKVRAAIPAPGECRPDWQIVCDVARRMGHGAQFGYRSESEIFAEHVKTTEGRDCDLTGMTPENLERGPLQWPCTSAKPEGADRLYTDGRFVTGDGLARFVVPAVFTVREPVSEEFPVSFTTGRARDQWHTMTKTGRVPELNLHSPEPVLEISPDDALRLGLRTGDKAEVASVRGSFLMKAEISPSVPAGTAFAPMHWGDEFVSGSIANNATLPAIDPVSKQPELKHAAVRISKFTCRAEGRVVIIGMGAAGIATAEKLRELQPDRPITMIGDEPGLHYNRVRLHEVLAGRCGPEALTVYPADWYRDRRIEVMSGTRVLRIDPAGRAVYLSGEAILPFDQLVIATGGVPSVPDVPGRDKSGVYSIRRLAEILKIRETLAPGVRACVIGAGPLGIEIAVALKEAGADVSLATHSDRPLRTQIDPVAAYLLTDTLAEAGISFHTESTVEEITGGQSVTGVRFTNGRSFDAELVIFATGISGDNRLAESAGLRVNRRIAVDSRMQSSVPGIYAVGEAAEFEGESIGLIPVARAMGETAAAALAGDPAARYRREPQILSLKLKGLELRASGRAAADPSDPEQEEITYLDRKHGRYRKVVLDRDRIVGVMAIGPFSGFVELHQRMLKGLRVGDEREILLSPAGHTRSPHAKGPVVCSCNSVTTGEIIAAIASGASSVREVGSACRAGTRCGSCRPEIAAMLNQIQGEAVPKPLAKPEAAQLGGNRS